MRGDITKISKSALPGKIASGYSCITLTRLRVESPVSTYHIEALRLKRAWSFFVKVTKTDGRGLDRDRVQTKMQKKLLKSAQIMHADSARACRDSLCRGEREKLFLAETCRFAAKLNSSRRRHDGWPR